MLSRSILLILTVAAIMLAGCQSEPAQPVFSENPVDSILVPEGNGKPVMIDGFISPGEWDDAYTVTVNDSLKLHFKKEADHVFIAVDCPDLKGPQVDLLFARTEALITQLHVSAQVGEIVIIPDSPDESDPPFQWGMASDWCASEIRWDAFMQRYLIDSAGLGDEAAFDSTSYGQDGVEIQIKKAKFFVDRVRFRISVGWWGNWDTPAVFPAGTERKNLEGWTTLIF